MLCGVFNFHAIILVWERLNLLLICGALPDRVPLNATIGRPVIDQQNVVPPGLSNVTQIAGGNVHSLALIAGGPPPSKVVVRGATDVSTEFSVLIPSRPGRVYRLEYKTSLSDTVWTALPLQAGQFPQTELIDPDTTPVQRFYRVRQW